MSSRCSRWRASSRPTARAALESSTPGRYSRVSCSYTCRNSPISARAEPEAAAASTPQYQHLLDFGDRLGGVEVLRAGAGAVQDRVAAIEAERVFERVEPLAGLFVAAVGQPAIGLQQHRRAEIALAVPPVGRARGRAAKAQNAFPQPVELGAPLDRLRPLAIRRRRALGLQPGLDRAVLRVDMRQVG